MSSYADLRRERLGPAAPAAFFPAGAGPSAAPACRVTHEAADGWATAVHRVSCQGVHLTLALFVPVGKEVTVELHDRARDYACRRRTRIVHALEERDGCHTIWGAFLQPLADGELCRLLRS